MQQLYIAKLWSTLFSVPLLRVQHNFLWQPDPLVLDEFSREPKETTPCWEGMYQL